MVAADAVPGDSRCEGDAEPRFNKFPYGAGVVALQNDMRSETRRPAVKVCNIS